MATVVALLSDFGAADPYVGALKGALLTACPDARLEDIVHDVAPQDVAAGALALASALAAFPPRTVFLAIVDPQAGSQRRGLALEAGQRFFVGPDNGLFTLVLREAPDATVHEIASRHAHARPMFAPIAARLAQGEPLAAIGRRIADPVLLDLAEPRPLGPDAWQGAVVHVDRFGNLITSFAARDFERILAAAGADPTELVVVIEGVVMPLVRSYADVAPGEPCALVGDAGRLEIAVNRGSASRTIGAGVGSPVRLRRA